MKSYVMQEGFRTGEIASSYDGQVSFEKYSQACKWLDNWIVSANGTISKRPGLRFIAPAKYSNRKCRLIPFEFSSEQAYQLEFGHQYVRFYANQGRLLSPDSYTKLLLNCNGTDASNTFRDSGVTGHTIAANGTAQISTAIKKFGSGSCKLSGAGDYLRIPDHADFDFSGGVFTLDAWVYITENGEHCIYYQQSDANTNIYLMTNMPMSGVPIGFMFAIRSGGATVVSLANTSIGGSLKDRWVHVAVVENGNSWYLFEDGVIVDSATNTNRAQNYASDVLIGSYASQLPPAGSYLKGYVDEIRVSKGIARWTSNFTLPIGEYPFGDNSGAPYELATTYTEDELPELQLAQSGDILFIVHPNHPPAKLSRLDHMSWTLGDCVFKKKYYPAIGMLTGDFDSYSLGGEKVKNGTFDADSNWTKGAGWTISAGVATKSSGNTNALSQDVGEAAGEIYKVTYTMVKTAGTDLTVFIGGTTGTTRAASGTYTEYIASAGTGDLSFSGTTDFAGTVDNVSVQKATPENYGNCIDDNIGTVGYNNDTDGVNSYLEIDVGIDKTIDLLGISLYVTGSAINATYDIEYHTGSDWVKVVTAWNITDKGLGWIETEWTPVGAKRRWRILKTNAASIGGNVMEVEFYIKGNPKEWVAGKYPSSITFFEERLWFAYAQHFWASKSGDFFNFTYGTKDDDAMQYTIGANQANKVLWLASGKVLVAGTSKDIYKLSASTLDEAITPLNRRIVREVSNKGTAYSEPISIDNVALYISWSRRKLREFTYNFENDSYVAPDMTILAPHLFTKEIKYMAFQSEPNSCLWAVRSDGILLGFTYQRLEGVTAWHKHTTDGKFECVSCIPNTTGQGYHELWAVVNRTIAGAEVRYIEMMEKETITEATNENMSDAFYVDSGLTYSGVPTATVSGLPHLNGKTVAVLADGVVQASKVVVAGAIPLDATAIKIQAGLPYDSIVQTMRIERKDNLGTWQGRRKRINQVVFRLYKAKQFKYGSLPNSNLKEKVFDTLYSGDWEADNVLGWDREGYVSVIADKPLPFALTAIISELEVN